MKWTCPMDIYPPYDEIDLYDADRAANLLEHLGFDLTTQHTKMTPFRLVKYLMYWLRPEREIHFTAFDNVDPMTDQMVVTGPTNFWACCSHHLLPFFGTIHFGYIPSTKLAGLSKISMFIQEFCARPWVQETMLEKLADALEGKLEPVGMGLACRAMHTCQMLDLETPAVPYMDFSVMRGTFLDPQVEARFMERVVYNAARAN